MKKYKTILMLAVSILCNKVNAQVINWGGNQGKQIINMNIGGDYGGVGGVGYARKIEAKQIPIWINVSMSTPFGIDILDDYKVKSGIEIRLLSLKKIQFSTSLQFVFRTINMDYMKAHNLGNELALTGGYYTSKWFIAGEFGLDKASLMHIKHKENYKLIYPEVKNGWYEVPNESNYNIGILTGLSFLKSDLYMKSGILRTQGFKSMPLLPFYAQLGYNYKF